MQRKIKIILLLSHGSPEKHAKQVLVALKNKLSRYLKQRQIIFYLYYAFLQFNRPTLSECFDEIIRRYNKHIISVVVLPVFISHGRHTLSHVPKIIKDIRNRHKSLRVKVALPLGSDDLVVKLLVKRYKESIRK